MHKDVPSRIKPGSYTVTFNILHHHEDFLGGSRIPGYIGRLASENLVEEYARGSRVRFPPGPRLYGVLTRSARPARAIAYTKDPQIAPDGGDSGGGYTL
jgi:hypothetical protein